MVIMMFENIPYDKKLHFIAGFIIAVIIGLIAYFMSFGNFIILGMAVSFAAGIGKEIRDEYVYSGFDWKDIVATWIGALVGGVMLSICCI